MKKGFTLIELLAVLVLLGVIFTITIPIIGSTISSSKKAAYNKQINLIENAARNYMVDNSKYLPDTQCKVTVFDLKEAGLLSNNDIKNPNYKSGSSDESENNENFEGAVVITKSRNKFKYKYSDSDSSENCIGN